MSHAGRRGRSTEREREARRAPLESGYAGRGADDGMKGREWGSVEIVEALELLSVNAYIVDCEGRISWQNRGSIEMLGDHVGHHFARLVAPEDAHVARTSWARKMIGEGGTTEYTLKLIGPGGRRMRVRASSTPLRKDGQVIGVFGVAYPADADDQDEDMPDAGGLELTARQHEVLGLLADGLGTAAIAERLGVAEETARNHIRAIFRQLDVHSRLEAVVRAYSLGLLQPPRED